MRRVLAIDTATPTVVTGVVELIDGRWPVLLAERFVDDHRKHAEVLTSLMRECLSDAGLSGADLDAVVVGCGPGPFTGLRVGMATGAAYADALGLPAYGVCSLDALTAAAVRATSSTDEAPGGDVLTVTDARRREVYWARYSAGRRIAGPDVCAPDALAAQTAERPVGLVAGTPGFTDRFGGEVSPVAVPTPASLVAVAAGQIVSGDRPSSLTPLYLRRPDAVELKDQRRKSLL